MTLHGDFSMNSDIDRLYVPRKKDGDRGLISVKFAIEHEQKNLSFYVQQSDDPYIRLTYQLYTEHGRQYKLSYNKERL